MGRRSFRSDSARAAMPPSIDDWSAWTSRFASFLDDTASAADAAHDRAHVERVVATARRLARAEGATLEVVLPAAWLHDCVTLPKDAPDRARAAARAAEAARSFLAEAGYPSAWLAPVAHAIEAHSYSGDVAPETPEARVVQDADRLDALGAVGLARCFLVGGNLGNALYDPDDPFCAERPPDDDTYVLDHLYAKLLRLPDTMQTEAGRAEAERRAQFLRTYLDRLAEEIGHPPPS
jgi:uncharacterized protein